MRCVVSCVSTSFPWLVFFGALLWGSRIHKHTGRWMWQGSASVVSWNWKKYSCHSKLVSTSSTLLLSVLSWRVFRAWNPHQLCISSGTWSLWQSQASVHLRWFLCWWLSDLRSDTAIGAENFKIASLQWERFKPKTLLLKELVFLKQISHKCIQ